MIVCLFQDSLNRNACMSVPKQHRHTGHFMTQKRDVVDILKCRLVIP